MGLHTIDRLFVALRSQFYAKVGLDTEIKYIFPEEMRCVTNLVDEINTMDCYEAGGVTTF